MELLILYNDLFLYFFTFDHSSMFWYWFLTSNLYFFIWTLDLKYVNIDGALKWYEKKWRSIFFKESNCYLKLSLNTLSIQIFKFKKDCGPLFERKKIKFLNLILNFDPLSHFWVSFYEGLNRSNK